MMEQDRLLQFYFLRVNLDDLPKNNRFKFMVERTVKENGISYGYANAFIHVSPDETDILRLWYLYNSVFFLSVHYNERNYIPKFDFILNYLSSVILYKTPAEACKEIDQYTLWAFDQLEEESTQKLQLFDTLKKVDSAATIAQSVEEEEKRFHQEMTQKLEVLFKALETEHFFELKF